MERRLCYAFSDSFSLWLLYTMSPLIPWERENIPWGHFDLESERTCYPTVTAVTVLHFRSFTFGPYRSKQEFTFLETVPKIIQSCSKMPHEVLKQISFALLPLMVPTNFENTFQKILGLSHASTLKYLSSNAPLVWLSPSKVIVYQESLKNDLKKKHGTMSPETTIWKTGKNYATTCWEIGTK